MSILFPKFPQTPIDNAAATVAVEFEELKSREKIISAFKLIVHDDVKSLMSFMISQDAPTFTPSEIFSLLDKSMEILATNCTQFLLTQNPAIRDLSSFGTRCANDGCIEGVHLVALQAKKTKAHLDWVRIINAAVDKKNKETLDSILFKKFTGVPSFYVAGKYIGPQSDKCSLPPETASRTLFMFLSDPQKAKALISWCPKETLKTNFLDYFLKIVFTPSATHKSVLALDELRKTSPEVQNAINSFMAARSVLKTKIKGQEYPYVCDTFSELVLMRSSDLMRDIVFSGQGECLRQFAEKENFWSTVLSCPSIIPAGLRLCADLGMHDFTDNQGNSPGHIAMMARPGRETIKIINKTHKEWLFKENNIGELISAYATNQDTKAYLEKYLLSASTDDKNIEHAPKRKI